MAPKPSVVRGVMLVFMGLVALGILGSQAVVEWWQVQHRKQLVELMDPVPVSCEPHDENNDKIVHIDCPLRRIQTLYPAPTFSWNVAPFVGVFLEMKVEMYQWQTRPAKFGIGFKGGWSSTHEASSMPYLFTDSHRNPEYWPHIAGQGRQFSDTVYAGDFAISSVHLQDFRDKEQLPLQDDGYYSPSAERPPVQVTGYNTHVVDDALYTGDPEAPEVGDIRIKFFGSTASHASAIGRQVKRKNRFHLEAVSEVAGDIVREGDYSANELIARVLREKDGSPWAIWSLRLFAWSFVACFVALASLFVDRDGNLSALGVALGSAGFAFATTCGLVAGPIWCLYSVVIGGLLVAAGAASGITAVVFWSVKPDGPRYKPVEMSHRSLEADLLQAPIGTAPIRTRDGTYVLRPI